MTTENVPQEILSNPEAVNALMAAVWGDDPDLGTVGEIREMMAREHGITAAKPIAGTSGNPVLRLYECSHCDVTEMRRQPHCRAASVYCGCGEVMTEVDQ